MLSLAIFQFSDLITLLITGLISITTTIECLARLCRKFIESYRNLLQRQPQLTLRTKPFI
jgi:hypothetical protein